MIILAALWASGASLFVFLTPVSMHGVIERLHRGAGSVVERAYREQTWYEAQGPWGVVVLLVFTGVFLLAVRLAWQQRRRALAASSLVAVVLVVISGFSIGGAYLPAALSLLAGAFLLWPSR